MSSSGGLTLAAAPYALRFPAEQEFCFSISESVRKAVYVCSNVYLSELRKTLIAFQQLGAVNFSGDVVSLKNDNTLKVWCQACRGQQPYITRNLLSSPASLSIQSPNCTELCHRRIRIATYDEVSKVK